MSESRRQSCRVGKIACDTLAPKAADARFCSRVFVLSDQKSAWAKASDAFSFASQLRRPPYTVIAALLHTLLVPMFTSCPARAADQVRIGIARTISDVGYYIADAKGFFRAEDLEISLINFNSAAQMVAPLGTGELEVGGGTVSAGLYNAVGRGILMKIVADQASIKPGYGFSSLMVRKDHFDSGRYKTLADLKGMKVAVGAPGTGSASALNEALKKGGLKFSDVEVVYIGFPEHLPAYKNKGIDASITNEPTMTRAIEDGVAVRAAGNDVTYPGQQTAVMFFSDQFIRKRALADRFMRAYIRGVRGYQDALKDGRIAGPNADEVIALTTPIKDAGMFRRMVPSWVDPNGEVNIASLRNDLLSFASSASSRKRISMLRPSSTARSRKPP